MGEAVKVIVRCRPMNDREKALKCQSVIEMETGLSQCRISKPGERNQPSKAFTFDGVYGPESITEIIYADICFPLVDGVVEGYNGTVFAYGQTGCGKSFSMQGISDPPSQRGIIPRAFEHVFESVQVAETAKYLIHATYLEIYNEDIRDLVGKDHSKKLEVKEHPDKGVYVKDLTMVPCHSVKDMERVMDKGGQNRHVGATLMNADSSRSHSIFTIYIETCETGADGQDHIRAGKLHLVDLAGSERQAKTGATGDRLKEATKINLSLSALGNVISALVDGKAKHIPYRDSKLTRLLQDSLGGNTKTMMVACISPADNNYDETLSTLRYANRAKNIKNKPKINEDPKDALLRQYQDEITTLKQILMGQMELTPDVLAKLGLSGSVAMSVAVPAARQSSPTRAPAPDPVVDVDKKALMEAETERIMQEYEEKLSQMQRLYEQEQLSKQKLEENLGKLLEEYEHNLQQAKQVYDRGTGQTVVSKNVEEWDDAEKVIAEFQAKSPGVDSRIAVKDGQSSPDRIETKSPKSSSRSDSPSLPNRMASKALGLVKDKLSMPSQNLSVSVAVRGGEFATPDIRESAESDITKTAGSGVVYMANQLTQEAVKRLQSLQQQLVGGEKSSDVSLKEQRRKRKEHALAKQAKLLKTVKKLEDDGIMVQVYDNMQEEIKIKTKLVEQRETDLRAANIEIQDLQAEFETEREDYLDTIRKLEQQLLLQRQIIDRMQPCIRRDCNYYNVDKVRALSVFDEESQVWRLPELIIERSVLPVVDGGPKGSSMSPRQNSVDAHGLLSDASDYHGRSSEEKLLARLNKGAHEDFANAYFKPKRPEKLLTVGAVHNAGGTGFDLFRKDPSPSTLSPPAAAELVRRPQKLEAIPADLLMKVKKKNGNGK